MGKGPTSIFGTGQLCGTTTNDLIRSQLNTNRKAIGPGYRSGILLSLLAEDAFTYYPFDYPGPVIFVTQPCNRVLIIPKP